MSRYAQAPLQESDTRQHSLDTDLEEAIPNHPSSLGETIFAMSTACLIHDYVQMVKGTSVLTIRLLRIIISFGMVLGILGLQVFLLRAVQGLLCASAVQHIRQDYSDYQLHMYGQDHVFKTENGYFRGLGGAMNVTKFAELPDDFKHSVCQIPLAHPSYSFAVLFIWTLTCFNDLRKTVEQIQGMLFLTPTVTSVDNVLQDGDGCVVTVVGLTMPMKFILGIFCLFPRLVSVATLNYLGCRWLLATNCLSDVLLNALALEFMMVLKELLYSTMASSRSKFITENTLVLTPDHGGLNLNSMFGSMMWALVAFIWVFLYMCKLQQVLPEYNWDVQSACGTWKDAVHLASFSDLFVSR